MKIIRLVFSIGISFFFTSICSGSDMKKNQYGNDQVQAIDQISPQQWEKLARKNFFFGHQSVGNNIIQGINEIQSNNPQIQLNLVETKKPADFDGGIFAHYSNIGKNDYPLSKIDDFVQILNDGLAEKTDVAFLKFCFVDFESGTNIETTFNKYSSSIAELKSQHSGVTFVHFTVPLLKKEQTGILVNIKNFVKGLMGKKKDKFFSNSHNVVRNEYNRLLRSQYQGKEPIFDIARLESIYPDGSRESFSQDGEQYSALVPTYTDDGGHLNRTGRKYIAENLLVFLTNL